MHGKLVLTFIYVNFAFFCIHSMDFVSLNVYIYFWLYHSLNYHFHNVFQCFLFIVFHAFFRHYIAFIQTKQLLCLLIIFFIHFFLNLTLLLMRFKVKMIPFFVRFVRIYGIMATRSRWIKI